MRVHPKLEHKNEHSKKDRPPSDFSGLSLLAASLRHQTTEFFNNSTLHGVRYIAEKDRPFCEKFMWFSFTAVGAVTTCIIIVSLWEKFQTNPTITGLDTDFHNWDVPFPAVTICDSNPVDDELLQSYIESIFGSEPPENFERMLRWLATLSYRSIAEHASQFISDSAIFGENEEERSKIDKDPKDAVLKPSTTPSLLKTMSSMAGKKMQLYCLYVGIGLHSATLGQSVLQVLNILLQIVRHCDSSFYDCEWKGDSEECCDMLIPVFTEMGFCYAFNSKHAEKTWPWQTQGQIEQFSEAFIHETDTKWSFLFNTDRKNTTFNIYIHSTEEMAGLEQSAQHSWDRRVEKVSFSVKHTYTTDDARQLSIRQRRCIFIDEVKLETSDIYTYSACMRQCRMQRSRTLCKCVPHFYPQLKGYKHCTIRQLKCIAENAATITDVTGCPCELGCSHTVYEVEKLSDVEPSRSEDNTLLETEFVSWPMVRYKREVLFGWVDLLVSFGGIAGLFLGFSLLSGVELLYYFTLRACCAAIRDADMLRQERIERLAKPKPPYDLSLVPWWKQPPIPRGDRPILVRSKNLDPPAYSPPPGYPTYLP